MNIDAKAVLVRRRRGLGWGLAWSIYMAILGPVAVSAQPEGIVSPARRSLAQLPSQEGNHPRAGPAERDEVAARAAIAAIVERRLARTGVPCAGISVRIAILRNGSPSAYISGSARDPEKMRQSVSSELEADGIQIGEFNVATVNECLRSVTPVYDAAVSADGKGLMLVTFDDVKPEDEAKLPQERECVSLGEEVRAQLTEFGSAPGFWIRRDSGSVGLCQLVAQEFEVRDLNVDRERAVKFLRNRR
jgi:hypothetical protein